jgi:hypothetical protein
VRWPVGRAGCVAAHAAPRDRPHGAAGRAGAPRQGLAHVNLSWNELGPGDAAAWGLALAIPGGALASLVLHDNPLGAAGGRALAVGLAARGCTCLAVLHLSDCGLADGGTQALAEAVITTVATGCLRLRLRQRL